MSVGQISYSGTTIPFLVAQTPVGHISDQAVAQSEELITAGVNGRRWRTLFDQFPSFEMVTFSEASDYNQAIIVARQVENLKEKLCRLSVTIGAGSYAYKDVHVSLSVAICHPGPMAGAGVGNGLAHVEARWQLELTDFGIGGGA